MSLTERPLIWLYGEVKSPPFSPKARAEAGKMLRTIQSGHTLSLPHSRPMPAIGPRCHELRIVDQTITWRIIYRIDVNAILIADVFAKKTQRTPITVLRRAKARLRAFDLSATGERHGQS